MSAGRRVANSWWGTRGNDGEGGKVKWMKERWKRGKYIEIEAAV